MDVKHAKGDHFKAVAEESDLRREVSKVKHRIQKKGKETFFFKKEIAEIKAIIPEVYLSFNK